MDARGGTTSWADQMTEEQIEKLNELVARHAWFERAPTSTGDPPTLVRNLTLGGPQGRRRFEVVGESEEVAELQMLMESIVQGRYETYLQRLPKAGVAR